MCKFINVPTIEQLEKTLKHYLDQPHIPRFGNTRYRQSNRLVTPTPCSRHRLRPALGQARGRKTRQETDAGFAEPLGY